MCRNVVKCKYFSRFLIFFFISLMSGCYEKKYADLHMGESIEHIQFTDFIDSIKVVPVNEDSFVVGAAKKIEKVHNFYYVLCQKQDAIIKYDESGRMYTILRRKGHARDEYTKIVDFSIDETNGTIVILCAGNKLMVYDLSFNLKYVKDLNSFCASVCAYKGNIMCYTNNRQIVKITDNEIEVMLKGEDLPAYVYELTPVFHKVGERLFAIMEYDDTIYELKNGEFVPVIAFSYPKQQKTIERMRRNEAMVEFDDIMEHSSVSVFNMMLQKGKLIILYSYDLLFRVCVIDMNSKQRLTDGVISGDFPKWISKDLCIGTIFGKDLQKEYSNGSSQVDQVGGDGEDSNFIIEYYLNI